MEILLNRVFNQPPTNDLPLFPTMKSSVTAASASHPPRRL